MVESSEYFMLPCAITEHFFDQTTQKPVKLDASSLLLSICSEKKPCVVCMRSHSVAPFWQCYNEKHTILESLTYIVLPVQEYSIQVYTELPSYPGYFQEPHWKSMGLLEISRVTWQLCIQTSIQVYTWKGFSFHNTSLGIAFQLPATPPPCSQALCDLLQL